MSKLNSTNILRATASDSKEENEDDAKLKPIKIISKKPLLMVGMNIKDRVQAEWCYALLIDKSNEDGLSDNIDTG